ncbi:hypothetical protein A3860_18055 [Niastella vici]|uniref:Uncharacterized protein n=1 Tax=Niastella vici TaxID=1703345 RepID=A0A1V9G1Z1_9BACT|nr:hypothetical protein [Niastella vici]OQP64665.1 hypothetical protein A3860_18055 [Niastella vici]
MRGTWIILLIMVFIGAGMYFWFTRKPKPAHSDTIVFKNTADSIVKKMQVYLGDDPKEVMYLDSAWMLSDSTPLKKVLDGVPQDTMNKQYSNITLFITYDHQSYYDLELQKPDPKQAYTISLEVEPMSDSDTLVVDGLIIPQKGDAMHFASPMMKMYSRFVITYNHKLPQPPPDSTAIRGHEPSKTITILKN